MDGSILTLDTSHLGNEKIRTFSDVGYYTAKDELVKEDLRNIDHFVYSSDRQRDRHSVICPSLKCIWVCTHYIFTRLKEINTCKPDILLYL